MKKFIFGVIVGSLIMIKKSAAAVAILALIGSIGLIVDNLNRSDTAKFAWDQDATVTLPDNTVKTFTLNEINALQYKVYIDGSLDGTPMIGVECAGTPPAYVCSFPLKNLNLTPTLHSLQLTTTFNGVESVKSAPLEVNFLVTTNK